MQIWLMICVKFCIYANVTSQQVLYDKCIILMDSIFSPRIESKRSRSRCYSSMNYQEYQYFFGTPPKMPAAPSAKPLEDPLEIPPLDLEEENKQVIEEPVKCSQVRKIRYKIETIPEIQRSEENSIAFQSPRKNYNFEQVSTDRLQQDGEQLMSIDMGARRRSRPRSYSENSPLNSQLKIIDFLRENKNKGRKLVKIQ